MNFANLARVMRKFAQIAQQEEPTEVRIYSILPEEFEFVEEKTARPSSRYQEMQKIYPNLRTALLESLRFFQKISFQPEQSFSLEIINSSFHYFNEADHPYTYRANLIDMRKALENKYYVQFYFLEHGKWERNLIQSIGAGQADSWEEALVTIDQEAEKIPNSQPWKAEISWAMLNDDGSVERKTETISSPILPTIE